jgi:hypothetical protein
LFFVDKQLPFNFFNKPSFKCMKKLLLFLAAAGAPILASAQCTTTNATSCQCANNTQTNCDLLPDITISWHAILNYQGGPNEYAQVCVPPCNGNDGRLRLTASTPNIGYGPLTVRGSQSFVCGTDTFSSNPGTCPDGSTPRQLIKQRIYQKNGATMTNYDRWAGGMTYHSSHGHNHVDDWGVFTLRIEDPNISDPRQWPIVASGGKLGFCLMDYYQCGDASANHHCKDDNTVYNQGTTLNNSSFPNFGLGGGQYSCSVVEQGISSGYTDVYDESLDLMWITLPPGLCNGQYWIVIEVDPNDNFLESDETNNYTAVPFTITQQNPANTAAPVTITSNKPSSRICAGDSIKLTATAGSSVQWSNGATTQSIWVSTPGTYSATVTNYCGTATSAPYTVYDVSPPADPIATGDTVCAPGVATLTATGSGTLTWKDGSGYVMATGPSFNTPALTSTTTYYVTSQQTFLDTSKIGPENNAYGTGTYQNATSNYLIFSTFSQMKLISVKVFSQNGGTQTFQLQDSTGAMVQTITTTVPAGESRVTLNWTVPAGNAWRLAGTSVTSLFRNNSNSTNYPYILNGVASITGSSAGPAYYYYFYDWEVETQNRYCESNPIAVTAVVDPCMSIDDRDLANNISLYPNPADNTFNLNVALPGTASVNVRITDLLGKTALVKHIESMTANDTEAINVEGLSSGAYMVSIRIGERTYFKKLIIQ